MPIIRRSDCVPLPIVVCPVVAIVMLESLVARCVHCVENVAWSQATFSTQWGKDGRCVGPTTLPPSCADCHEIWEPQPPGTLRACPGLYRYCFTFM